MCEASAVAHTFDDPFAWQEREREKKRERERQSKAMRWAK
jgi:hypothetical protein